MSHTPGPWSYLMRDNYARIFLHNHPDKQNLYGSDNLAGYCGEANARLIAAAPELLEALEEWANCMPVLCDDPECPDCPRVRRTRELIAKAKGEK